MLVKNRVTRTIIVLLGFMALMMGFFIAQHIPHSKHPDLAQFQGTWLEKPRPVSAFALTGIDGKPFDNQSLQGQWTMVFFGFTNCGYLCPTTMAELGKMYRILAQKHVQPMVRVVMVSVDPKRDSQAKLKAYVAAFDPHFYGARGSQADVKKLAQELGIAYITIKQPKDKQNYDIEHSGTVMLFNPQGQLNGFFTTPHQAEVLAKDYQLIMAA